MIKNTLFALITSCLLIVSLYSHAQHGVKSGSLQIVIFPNTQVRSEITGPLSFNETISENIILSNLIPGEYMIKIHLKRQVIANQIIIVNPEQRAIVNISKGQVLIRNVFDENSQYIHTPIPDNTLSGLPMNEDQFKKFQNSVKQASFPKDMYNVVSSATDYAIFSTEQVKRTIELFSFENDKLNCAKVMSKKVHDKQNLYSVADTFAFPNTKNQFFDFIKKH